jgi:uridine kinase
MEFDAGLAHLSSAAQEFAAKTPPARRLLLAIAGGSMSGKSFLAAKLRERLRTAGHAAALVHLDNYFRDLDDPGLPRTEAGKSLFDAPGSYHGKEFQADVLSLLHGVGITSPQYEKTTCQRLSKRVTVLPSKIVIAEGLFAIRFLHWMPRWEPSSLSIKVYMDAKEEVRQARRIEHDMPAFGATEEGVKMVFRNIILPCHKRYVEPQKIFADLVIDTTPV